MLLMPSSDVTMRFLGSDVTVECPVYIGKGFLHRLLFGCQLYLNSLHVVSGMDESMSWIGIKLWHRQIAFIQSYMSLWVCWNFC